MNTKKLKELAALSQLMEGFQRPAIQRDELRSREEGRMLEMALGLMGLSQKSDLAQQQMALDREQIGVARDRQQGSQFESIIGALPMLSQTNPELANALGVYLESQFPQFAAARGQVRDAAHAKDVGIANSKIGQVYETYKDDPKKLKTGLAGLAELPGFNDADWQRFNSSLPAGEVPMPPGGPVTEQIYPLPGQRTGVTPEWEAQMQRLFGPKPTQPQAYSPGPEPVFNAWLTNTVVPALANVGRAIQSREPLAYSIKKYLDYGGGQQSN